MKETTVALYTSAWIEISGVYLSTETVVVALYTSAWIEIATVKRSKNTVERVALYTSAWIEMIGRRVSVYGQRGYAHIRQQI